MSLALLDESRNEVGGIKMNREVGVGDGRGEEGSSMMFYRGRGENTGRGDELLRVEVGERRGGNNWRGRRRSIVRVIRFVIRSSDELVDFIDVPSDDESVCVVLSGRASFGGTTRRRNIV